MQDIKVKLENTQVIQHITGNGPIFEFQIKGNEIDLDKIIDSLLDQS